MKYMISENIPVPPYGKPGPKKGEGGARATLPFFKMGVGDSFIYSSDSTESKLRCASNAARNWAAKAKLNWKFTVRKLEEGIRIWRIS